MIHYYIHHGSPSGGHLYDLNLLIFFRFFNILYILIDFRYYMKRYHYQHHFVQHSKGFGISSSIWDEAFGTKIILRKLQYLLKW